MSEVKEVKFRPMNRYVVLYDVDDEPKCGGTYWFSDDYAELWVDDNKSLNIRINDEFPPDEIHYILIEKGILSSSSSDGQNFSDPRVESKQIHSILDCFKRNTFRDALKTNIENARVVLSLMLPSKLNFKPLETKFGYYVDSNPIMFCDEHDQPFETKISLKQIEMNSRDYGNLLNLLNILAVKYLNKSVFGDGYIKPALYGAEISFSGDTPAYFLTFSGDLYYNKNSNSHNSKQLSDCVLVSGNPKIERFKQGFLGIIQVITEIKPKIDDFKKLKLNQPQMKISEVKDVKTQIPTTPKSRDGM